MTDNENLPAFPVFPEFPDDAKVVPVAQISPLRALRSALLALDDQRLELEAAGDWETLANGAADLNMLLADLRTMERDTKLGVARLLDAKWEAEGKLKRYPDGRPRTRPKEEVAGLGLVEVEGGMERKGWESEKILRRLIFTAITTPDGEPVPFDGPGEVAEAIYAKVAACLPLTASLSWRVGQLDKATGQWSGLRGAGIEPGDVCEEVEKDRTVKVPKRNAETA